MQKIIVVAVMGAILGGCTKNQNRTPVDSPEEAAKKIEAAMQAEPPFAVAKKYDPDVYNSAIAALHDEAKRGASTETMVAATYNKVIAVEMKRLQAAPNETIVPFEKTVITQLRQLNIKNSDACFYWLFPGQHGKPRIEEYLPKSLIDESHVALANAIQSSIENPQPVPSLSDVSMDLQLVQSKLQQYYGNRLALLQKMSDSTADRQTVCDIIATQFSYILDLPEERAGMLLRYFYSKT